MKKLIFILTALLLITACSSDRDNNNSKVEIKPSPDFYKKYTASYILFQGRPYGTNTSYDNVKINSESEGDIYTYIESDNTVILKIFKDMYSGKLQEVYTSNGIKFIDSKTKKTILIERGNGIMIDGIREINSNESRPGFINKWEVSGNTWSLKLY
ncbi:hypothetical protein FCL53_17155 [Elizabethkingia meningoseptica]|uniref:hypothetical protein n=1 Tax=Elizabethkingia meningoseptica TaxID=238 RepID=UPI0013657D25|nr:hypothetical protein [Elizabethkingia meningoseptica]MVW93693.1 hypothetical protein [Elizabethkingia meningoseptica]